MFRMLLVRMPSLSHRLKSPRVVALETVDDVGAAGFYALLSQKVQHCLFELFWFVEVDEVSACRNHYLSSVRNC